MIGETTYIWLFLANVSEAITLLIIFWQTYIPLKKKQ